MIKGPNELMETPLTSPSIITVISLLDILALEEYLQIIYWELRIVVLGVFSSLMLLEQEAFDSKDIPVGTWMNIPKGLGIGLEEVVSLNVALDVPPTVVGEVSKLMLVRIAAEGLR